jgi:hypothetical protein
MNSALTIAAAKHKRDWDKCLYIALLLYRTTVNSSTGLSPFYVLYGRHARAPIDIALEAEERKSESCHEYESYYKSKHEEVNFEAVQWVMIWDPPAAEKLPKGKYKPEKLCDKWTGPYRVLGPQGTN